MRQSLYRLLLSPAVQRLRRYENPRCEIAKPLGRETQCLRDHRLRYERVGKPNREAARKAAKKR